MLSTLGLGVMTDSACATCWIHSPLATPHLVGERCGRIAANRWREFPVPTGLVPAPVCFLRMDHHGNLVQSSTQ